MYKINILYISLSFFFAYPTFYFPYPNLNLISLDYEQYRHIQKLHTHTYIYTEQELHIRLTDLES